MPDIIDMAIKDIGYKEAGENRTKFGGWYGMNGAPWCHMAASYWADKAGISTSIVPKTASTSVGMDWFKKKGRFKLKGNYTPKRNDLVYFKTGRSHVGVVEYVKGNTLHTIEGNTGDMVARRTYPLSHATITGYGLVNKYITNSGGGSSSNSSPKKSSASKTQKVKKDVKKNESKSKKKIVPYDPIPYSGNHKVDVFMMINNGKKLFEVPVEDGCKVAWERKNTAGKLIFTTLMSSQYKISEGNAVRMKVNGKDFFYGFVFTLHPSQEGTVEVTVYDQLRYLKNKDTYAYTNWTTNTLIRKIAKDFGLRVGSLDKTKYPLSLCEDDQELFDIIGNSLDETLVATGNIYTLYDNCGKLMLRKPWKVNCLINEFTAQSYDFTSTIDSNVYNKVVLVYEKKNKNGKGKILQRYFKRSPKLISKWGVLQYYEKINSAKGAMAKAKQILKMYNKISKTVSIGKAFGNVNVRPGCLIPVVLKVGNTKISNYMLVDRVTHSFSNYEHTMDLELTGGGFDSSQ